MLRIFAKRKCFSILNTRLLSSITSKCNAERKDDYPARSLMDLSDLMKPAENYSLADAFNSLFEMYKRNDPSQIQNILSSREFSNYCKLLKRNSPKMEMNEIITCVKVLNRLQIKSNSKMMQQLLHLLKDNINTLSISQLAFLNMLLKQMEPTPLIEALIIAIPIVFKLQISLQIDHENADELQKIFHHVTLTDMKIGTKALMNIITALTIHGSSLSFFTAASCLISLSKLPLKILQENPAKRLTENCFNIINSPQVVFADFHLISTVLHRIIMQYKATKFMQSFYNPKFFNKIVDYIIQDDLGFEKAYSVMELLNDIHFVNYSLLDYIDQKIIQDESILKNMELLKLKELIHALSLANYKTKNWEILKSILHENSAFSEDFPIFIPILKMTSELLSLDFVSRILLQKVLHPDFLNEHLRFFSKHKNFSPLSHLRIISQTISLLYPEHNDILPPKIFMDIANEKRASCDEYHLDMLEFIYGSHTVMKNIKTAYGHRIDFVINFDNEGKAVEVSKKIENYEDLPTHKLKCVAVSFQSRKHCPVNFPMKYKGIPELRRRTLEKIGIKEVIIPTYTLDSLPDAEKCAYVEREISEGSTFFETS